VAAAVPVQEGGETIALLCLGRKRSGDVYTVTDYTLLGAVANQVAKAVQGHETEGARLDGVTLLSAASSAG
jgi:GAF domain-containing protein